MFSGVGAFVWWGCCPGFFPLLLPAGSLEVLAHRIVWSALCLAAVLLVARRFGDLRRLSGRTWLLLAAASALISLNWGVYIYATTHGHVVDAALGYFINPLVTVALGVLVFRERIGRWQLVALVLAAVDRRHTRRVVRGVWTGEEGGGRRSPGQRRRRDLPGTAAGRGSLGPCLIAEHLGRVLSHGLHGAVENSPAPDDTKRDTPNAGGGQQ